MTRVTRWFTASFLLLTIPMVAAADCPAPSAYARFNVKTYETEGLCTSQIPTFGYVFVSVSVTTLPASKIRFSLPNPPFGTVVSEQWSAHTGDRISGMEFSMDCTGPKTVNLGEFTLFITGPVPCTTWRVNDGCEVLDCDGRNRVAKSINNTFSNTTSDCVYCFQQCSYFPPYDLFPGMSATNVPASVAMTFNIAGVASNHPQGDDRFWIAIGTDPNCGNWQEFEVDRVSLTFAPGFLLPQTTYYWTARWSNFYTGCAPGGARSELHSFTTGGVLAVEPTTWGRVKAMYRE